MDNNIMNALSSYWTAKDAYDAAVKGYSSAKQIYDEAYEARRQAWSKLEAITILLPDEARDKIVATQFHGAPRGVEIVHILRYGSPLCLFITKVPGEWPEGHKWVGIDETENATCVTCLKIAENMHER